MFISKSLFVEFVTYKKLARFKKNEKKIFDWIKNFDDEDYKNYLIKIGKTAEELVKQLLENKFQTKSCNISPYLKPENDDYDKECIIINNKDLVKKTNKNTLYHIKKKSKILYQPGFIYKDCFIVSDFLVWNEKSKKYDLLEVKSKTSIRNYKLINKIKFPNLGKLDKKIQADISFQRYVIKKRFKENFNEDLLGDIYIVYLNKFYVKNKKIELDAILEFDKIGTILTKISKAEMEENNGFKTYTIKTEIIDNFLKDKEIEDILNEIRNSIGLSEKEFESLYPRDGTSYLKYFGPKVIKFLGKEHLLDKILSREEDINKHVAFTIFGKGFKISWNSKIKKQKVIECLKKGKIKFEDFDMETINIFSYGSKGHLSSTGRLIHKYLLCKKNNKVEHMEKEIIKEFFNNLRNYLIFYDYETISTPLPFLENTRPYQQIPIQISTHIVSKHSNKLIKHFGLILIPSNQKSEINFKLENTPKIIKLEENFLIFGNYDNLINSFIKKVKETIGDLNNGSFIVWNKGFENNINKTVAILNPYLEKDLFTINKNTFDLMKIYKHYHHFHLNTYGSYSIKYVLPAINNEINYNKLNIKNGEQAQKNLENILKGILIDGKEYYEFTKQLNDLFIYCGLDSYAMWTIYDYLKNTLGL